MFPRIPVLLAPICFATGCVGLFADRDEQKSQNLAFNTSHAAPPNTELALRVDRVGRKLLSGSPFLFPTEPTFHTIGQPHVEMFHRDAGGLFLTEGVVQLCQSEEELAAVLAHELAHMCSEMRRAERMRLPEPIPTEAQAPPLPGGPDTDPARLIQMAELELNHRKPAERKLLATTDPKKIAADILKDAGYDSKLLKQVEPILRQAKNNQKLAKQLAGPEDQRNWIQ